MPTLARSQHKAFMCFSVREEDAEYGLSDDQQEAEARPHQLKAAGMAILDFPGQDSRHVPMPLRTWDWALGIPEGASEAVRDKAAVSAMTAYSAQFPAQVKGMDEFTRRLTRFPTTTAVDQAATHEAIAAPAASGGVSDVVDVDTEDGDDLGELLAQAAELIITAQHASSAMLSRKLRLPHHMAVQILEALEMKGVVGPQPAGLTEPREVLVSVEDGETVIEGLREDGHPIAEYLRTEDPDPEVVAGPYDEIHTPTLREDQFNTRTAEQEQAARAGRMDPEAARALVHAWIVAQGLGASFPATHPELTEIRVRTGNKSRAWTNKVLTELVNLGALEVNTNSASHLFTVVDLDPIHAGRALVDA
jgi:DNA translocase FtsK/SpoIIIE-like protein